MWGGGQRLGDMATKSSVFIDALPIGGNATYIRVNLIIDCEIVPASHFLPHLPPRLPLLFTCTQDVVNQHPPTRIYTAN